VSGLQFNNSCILHNIVTGLHTVGLAITTLSEAISEVYHSKLGACIWQFCFIHGDIIKSPSL